MPTKTQTAQRNITFQLVPNTFLRTGYHMIGWNENWQSATVQYRDKAEVTFDGDRDLYAIWEPNGYIVHMANGYDNTPLSDINTKFDTPFLVNALSRTGYKFKGWFVTSGLNSSTAKYGVSTTSCNTPISSSTNLCANGFPSGIVSFKNLTTMADGQVTITAQWQAIAYNVKFNKNATEASGSMADQSFNYNEFKKLAANAFTRTGYNMDGWSTSSTGAKVYEDEQSVGNLTTIDGGIVNLYAVWKAAHCTITFDPNGGSGGIPQRVVTQGSQVGELPTTTMQKPSGLAGMEFDGWWTQKEGGSRVSENTVIPTECTEITYYAHWLGVIHYRPVYKNTTRKIDIDQNGIASGFYGNSTIKAQCALESIPQDKFDFSGEFEIVMKCEKTYDRYDPNETWAGDNVFRCDVFGGYNVEGSQNQHMDFGILVTQSLNRMYTQWEIASNYNDIPTVGTYHQQGAPFLLKVERRKSGSKWRISTFYSTDGVTW